MTTTNQIGAIGEARIEYEATKRGYGLAIPRGHSYPYDLIVDRNDKLEKIQVKTVRSDGEVLKVPCYSTSKHIDGKKKSVPYISSDFDWLAIFDITTDQCFFVPSVEMTQRLYLRLVPTKNNQKRKVRWAKDYLEW